MNQARKKRIFCILGKSASGKDAVFNSVIGILQNDHHMVHPIVQYTTRPPRTGETNHEDYHFIADIEELADGKSHVIDKRDYDTEYGVWQYAITLEEITQYDDDADLIAIETPEGLDNLLHNLDDESVAIIPIYLDVDDRVRLERSISRESRQSHPRYDEVCRRFLSDQDDFKDFIAGLEVQGVYSFPNDDQIRCATEIAKFIEGFGVPLRKAETQEGKERKEDDKECLLV